MNYKEAAICLFGGIAISIWMFIACALMVTTSPILVAIGVVMGLSFFVGLFLIMAATL